MEIKSNINGTCPLCNKDGVLEYGEVRFEGDLLYFPWKCSNCEETGEEWYETNFIGHNIYDKEGNCIEIQDHLIGKEV